MAIAQNQALFSLLGTNFGGDGRTTFALPDLRGQVPVGMGQGPGTVEREFASVFGQDEVTLTLDNLTMHQHIIQEIQPGQTVSVSSLATVNASNAQADKPNPKDGYWAKSYSGSRITPSYTSSPDITMASDAVLVDTTASFNASNLTTSSGGGSQPFSVNPPSLTMTYSICLYGIYPSRD
jgi:microcystin-dependent protein